MWLTEITRKLEGKTYTQLKSNNDCFTEFQPATVLNILTSDGIIKQYTNTELYHSIFSFVSPLGKASMWFAAAEEGNYRTEASFVGAYYE